MTKSSYYLIIIRYIINIFEIKYNITTLRIYDVYFFNIFKVLLKPNTVDIVIMQ